MKIFVHRPDGNLGPYSEFDLRSMVRSGLIKPDELGWQDGMKDWKPLYTFVALANLKPESATTAPASSGKKVNTNVKSFFSGPPSRHNDEGTRDYYRNAENNIRMVGWIYYLGGLVFILAGAWLLQQAQKQPHPTDVQKIEPFVAFAAAILYFWLGRLMQTLNPAGVIPVTILACIGMLNFPAGTIINGVVLFILHGTKGHVVFSPEYREVVKRTPKLNRRVGLLTGLAFGLVVMVVLYLVYASWQG